MELHLLLSGVLSRQRGERNREVRGRLEALLVRRQTYQTCGDLGRAPERVRGVSLLGSSISFPRSSAFSLFCTFRSVYVRIIRVDVLLPKQSRHCRTEYDRAVLTVLAQ